MSKREFPRFRFAGSHREIGRQYGTACETLIRRHLELARERLERKAGVGYDRILGEALLYRRSVQEHAPYFDEEIVGLAEGAGIGLEEAYFLQLRAELVERFLPRRELETTSECTTFALQGRVTADGVPLVGQNADLPDLYTELGVVVEFVPDDGPAILMLTPAGQISYIGINDAGLAVCANYLVCDGWRIGFPRYLWSRYALRRNSLMEAVEAVEKAHRASSRNLIMLDSQGEAIDLETTPRRTERIGPEQGILVHANHYLSDRLADEERAPARDLQNSRARQRRMEFLLDERRREGRLDVEAMKEVLRDREGCPDALCRKLGDDDSDIVTFASVIAEPSRGRLWVAVGPPHEHEYVRYEFTGESVHAE